MFEKEAKEYTHTKHCEKCFAGHCEKKCFLVKDDFETFKDGAEFGYNRANEWHYVKDGDLPKEGTVCLTARTIISGNVAYDVCSYYEGLFGENWFAWKEIILPKEMD